MSLRGLSVAGLLPYCRLLLLSFWQVHSAVVPGPWPMVPALAKTWDRTGHSYHPTNTHVALVFVGEARTLNRTFCNLMDNVIVRLQEQRHRITILVLAEADPTLPHYDLLYNLPDTEGAIYTLPRPDVPLACCESLQGVHQASHYVPELLASLRMRAELGRLLRAHNAAAQASGGGAFASVVRLRPDVLYLDPLPLGPLQDAHAIHFVPWHHYDGINDRFAIMSPRLAEVYFGLYGWLCTDRWVERLPLFVYNAERLYLWALSQTCIPLVPIATDFSFVRVRKQGNHWGPFHLLDLQLVGRRRCTHLFSGATCNATASPPHGHAVWAVSSERNTTLRFNFFCRYRLPHTKVPVPSGAQRRIHFDAKLVGRRKRVHLFLGHCKHNWTRLCSVGECQIEPFQERTLQKMRSDAAAQVLGGQ